MGRSLFQSLVDDGERRADPERFLHVMGVTHVAAALAFRHGLDVRAAAAAALIHDRSKGMEPEEIESDLQSRGGSIPNEERDFARVWHGWHAAETALADFGLEADDAAEEIREAVRLHSTADEAMGELARLLFVADFIEPGRDFEGVEELRRAARENLDEGFKLCLEAKCRYLADRGRPLSPRAARALAYYGIELSDLTMARKEPMAREGG